MLETPSVRIAAVALIAAAAVATSVSTASATTLTNGFGTLAGGTPLAPGATVAGGLVGTAVITAPSPPVSGSASCTVGSVGGRIDTTNPAPTVSISSSPVLTLSSCTGPSGAGGPLKINSVTLSSLTSAGVTYGSSAASFIAYTGAQLTVNAVASGLTQRCSFTVNALTGIVRNTDPDGPPNNTVTFTNVPISSATGICNRLLPGGTVTAKFGPLLSASNAVAVNP